MTNKILLINPDLEIAHMGECKTMKSSMEECLGSCAAIAIFAPVCGSDGKTYTNKGELACHQRCGNSGGFFYYVIKFLLRIFQKWLISMSKFLGIVVAI